MGRRRSPRRPRLPPWCWPWRARCLGSSRWSWAPAHLWTLDQSAAGRWVPSGREKEERGDERGLVRLSSSKYLAMKGNVFNSRQERSVLLWSSYINTPTEPVGFGCCSAESREKGTYHVGVERRGDFLGIEVVPVDGGEEYVVLNFNLWRDTNDRLLNDVF